MKILHISDTHNKHHSIKELPKADILIHSGDFSFSGTEQEFQDFLEWFVSLDYQYKIFIGGNHDCFLEDIDAVKVNKLLPKNCYYLYNNGIEIEGLKFWGIPLFMPNVITDKVLGMYKSIPLDTNILITHQPPFGFLDKAGNHHMGNNILHDTVVKINPQYHLFGHIHDAYGVHKSENTVFSNAALVDENYKLSNSATLLP